MESVTRTVPVDELPEAWREGFNHAKQVVVTIADVPSATETDDDVLGEVAGLWKDRDDLDALYSDMRAKRREKFERLTPGD
jgi:hypothetical protein